MATWTREQWRRGTDWNTVCARAAARKKHNEARRRFMYQTIDQLVWPRLLKYGYDRWGVCAKIGREIGLSRSSVCRYRQRIFRELRGR